jgi:hypothetical protein
MDQLFVSFQRAWLYLLDAPIQAMQQAADVILMVAYTEFSLNHLLDTPLRPLLGWITRCLRTRLQLLDQRLFLLPIQPRRSACRFPPAQRFRALRFQPLLPVADCRLTHTQITRYLGLRHLPGLKQAHAFLSPFGQLLSCQFLRLPCHVPYLNRFS